MVEKIGEYKTKITSRCLSGLKGQFAKLLKSQVQILSYSRNCGRVREVSHVGVLAHSSKVLAHNWIDVGSNPTTHTI